MIITLTGKPFSGKDSVAAYIVKQYGFESFTGGDIFRRIATERGLDILELNRKKDISIDKLVDDEIKLIGAKRADDDLVIVSRTAWMFLPDAFNVFLDIDEDEQIRRMRASGRTNEKVDLSDDEARASVRERFNLENERYLELYGHDNRDLSNYDLVINTTGLSIEEVGENLMQNYEKYKKNRK